MELTVSKSLINVTEIAVAMDAEKFIIYYWTQDGWKVFSELDGLQNLRLLMTSCPEYPAFLFEPVSTKLHHVFIFCFYHDKVFFGALTSMR